MDEAEALCDNIVIMVNGRFVVHGSPGYLKDEYGTGYIINLRFVSNAEIIGQYTEFVEQNLSFLNKLDEDKRKTDETVNGVEIYELSYQSNELGSLSHLFTLLCRMKFELNLITDFQVTRSSLDQVFMKFAKH